jgi:signal recognition particle receptor subunit beta
VPLLVMANKQDLLNAMSPDEVRLPLPTCSLRGSNEPVSILAGRSLLS